MSSFPLLLLFLFLHIQLPFPFFSLPPPPPSSSKLFFSFNPTLSVRHYTVLLHSTVHKVLSYIEYRTVSGVFRTIDPQPLSTQRVCPPPPYQRRGVSISEDARHWIGLLQYKPSTVQWTRHIYINSHVQILHC